MDGQPTRPGVRAQDRVRHARGQEDPVARGEVDRFAVDLERGGAGQDHDPLVLILDEVLRTVGAAAQDLFDDQVAEGDDLLEPLTVRRCLGSRQ